MSKSALKFWISGCPDEGGVKNGNLDKAGQRGKGGVRKLPKFLDVLSSREIYQCEMLYLQLITIIND